MPKETNNYASGWKRVFILALFIIVIQISPSHGDDCELNTILMRSTFKIENKDGVVGTVFIVGKPVSGDSKEAYFVLVTAAHVLASMKEDVVTLIFRKNHGANEFSKVPFRLPIRNKSVPLWKEHPKADVAVMYISVPPGTVDIQMLPISILATDEDLLKLEVHPGDKLSCLGYPLRQEANEAGFPILRSGQIASYPLTPTTTFSTFLYDFRIFKGNSGGPVYIDDSNRNYGGGTHLGKTQKIIGLVSQEGLFKEKISSLTETTEKVHPLSLAVVVHASLIKEAIDLLPPKERCEPLSKP